jgi:hypothetical protein
MDDFVTNKKKTARSQAAASLLIIAGFALFFLGIVIALTKGSAMVAIMALPVIIVAFLIRHNSKK